MTDTPTATLDVEFPPAMTALYSSANSSIGRNMRTKSHAASVGSMKSVLMVPKDDQKLAEQMWNAYLELLPPEHRQYFTCSECRRWFFKYATIQSVCFIDGQLTRNSLCWELNRLTEGQLSELEIEINNTMREMALSVTPTRLVFDRKQMLIGRAPGKENYDHFFTEHIFPKMVSFGDIKTNDEYVAKKAILTEFLVKELSIENVTAAHKLFSFDPEYAGYSTHAYRVGLVKTAMDVLAGLSGKDRGIYLSLLPLTELTSIRANLVGEFLLELEKSGMDAAKRLFDTMVDPTTYRQPTALLKAQQVEQAEKLIAELNLKDSLLFDPAKADDPAMPLVVRYPGVPKTEAEGGVFSHLKTSETKQKADEAPIDVGILSFESAWSKYLSTALEVELEINPHVQATYGVVGVMQNREATPILRYDLPDKRCPIAALIFNKPVAGVRLALNRRVKVDGVVVDPATMDKAAHTAQWFFLTGITEQAAVTVGNLLSTQVLPELHDFWNVLHQYSVDRSQTLDPGSAILLPIARVSGMDWRKLSPITKLYVTTPDGKFTFSIATA